MENRKETSENIIKIVKKINNFKRYILEYGFNEENDIFIKEGLVKLNEELENILNEIKYEK